VNEWNAGQSIPETEATLVPAVFPSSISKRIKNRSVRLNKVDPAPFNERGRLKIMAEHVKNQNQVSQLKAKQGGQKFICTTVVEPVLVNDPDSSAILCRNGSSNINKG